MLKKITLSFLFLILPFTVWANHNHESLEGTYLVSGLNPISGPYNATAVINKVGEVYVGNWVYPDPSGPIIESSTGIRIGKIISFVYFSDGIYGVASYKIKDDGDILEGIWTDFGSSLVGEETLVKISEAS